MVNQCTLFEVSRFTRYEDVNGGAKCRKLGGLRWLINQSCFFRVVQVTKSLQDPLEVGNSLPGISDNVRE